MPVFNVHEAIVTCFMQSLEDSRFSSSRFFKRWFPMQGSGYYFLFKKNLRATTIQFPELISLLRMHVSNSADQPVGQLQFVSTDRFREWIESLVRTLNPKLDTGRFRIIANLYAPMLERTVILDPFYTSCAVFLPPHLSIDLLSVCAYSGYIHSCGRNVFIRKINKTKKEHLFSSLDDFLGRQTIEGKRIFFTVYAHEDFTDFDRDTAGDLQFGLDGVKIYVEKFYMGEDRLVSVLKEMRTKYSQELEIPDPGDFRTKHKEFRNHPNVDTSRTLWLIQDQGIGPNLWPSNDRYFICYDQSLINENPFHIFDENKPAWISHTTIPHTLMGAMINIVRPGCADHDAVTLCDPFVGTGTTWLETLKYQAIQSFCSDVSPLSRLLCRDNVEFFCQGADELKRLSKKLGALIHLLYPRLNKKPFPSSKTFDRMREIYEWAQGLAEPERANAQVKEELRRELKLRSFFERLVWYLVLRTRLRNIAGFEREARDFDTAFVKEANVLLEQIRRLRQLRERQLNSRTFGHWNSPTIQVFQGEYSLGCSISLATLCRQRDSCESIEERDVRAIPEGAYQAIVTDPPYGFNTQDEALELGELWAFGLRAMIRALQDGGHLVMCLPDRSHTGRSVQVFAHKQFITQHVLAIAEEVDREVVISADVLPKPTDIFRPPFYWESERALRRAIVHFRIHHKRSAVSDKTLPPRGECHEPSAQQVQLG